jgi:signal transduction histidine kinase
MQAREEERASVARWIEDDLCQKIVEVSMRLHAISMDDGVQATQLRTRLRQIRDDMSALAAESLSVSDPLYAKLDLLGVAVTSRVYCEQRCAEHDVTLDFAESGVPQRIPRSTSIALFRVLQEALTNALRHAHSRRVAVSLRGEDCWIEFEVADEGVGFDPERVAKEGGLGLVAMRERVRLVGGGMSIDSRVGGGTRISGRVPVPVPVRA